jgi:MFS family permease
MTPSSQRSRVVRVTGERLQRLFGGLEGNARVLVVTEGVAGVAFQWYVFYLPLYMVALGVTKLQVGILASLMLASQVVSTFVGGYLADRLGRKRVLVVFDIFCWGIPLTLYAIARDPWYFFVGRFITGFVYLVVPSFECLFVEDVPLEKRQTVFGALQFLMAADSLLTPVAGLVVAHWGMELGGRLIMGLAALVAVATAVYRQFTLRETTVGQQRMSTTASMPLSQVVREFRDSIVQLARNADALRCLSVRYVSACAGTVAATFSAIYLADGQAIGLAESTLSVLPFVSAVVTMLLLTMAVHRLRPEHEQGNLLGGMVLNMVGSLALVLAPARLLLIPIVWAILRALANGLFRPAIQSYWANVVPDDARAQTYSVTTALESLLMLPIAPLAGWLYTLGPRWPFVLGLCLEAAAVGLILLIQRHTKPTPAAA